MILSFSNILLICSHFCWLKWFSGASKFKNWHPWLKRFLIWKLPIHNHKLHRYKWIRLIDLLWHCVIDQLIAFSSELITEKWSQTNWLYIVGTCLIILCRSLHVFPVEHHRTRSCVNKRHDVGGWWQKFLRATVRLFLEQVRLSWSRHDLSTSSQRVPIGVEHHSTPSEQTNEFSFK